MFKTEILTKKINLFKEEFKKPKVSILLFFSLIYSLISIVNHYNYRTYAFDLGIYNNCLYQYGHFHKNHYPYLHNMFSNFLSDHFSLYTVILSPLYYVLGSYTLLIVQILSILFGSVGIYKIVKQTSSIKYLPEIAMIHYLSFFGIFSALSFDYHDNVISAMLMPWFFYYFLNNKFILAWLFAVLIVIGKENMPIWLFFVCVGLALLHIKDMQKRNAAILLSIFSLAYAILVIKYIMPNIDPEASGNGYNQHNYSIIGSNLKELFYNLVYKTKDVFNAAFHNHLTDYTLNGIKEELYIALLLAGGWILIIRPFYLIMLIPIIAQKVFSDAFTRWGISYHYSIEFAPIIIIAFYDSTKYINYKKINLLLATVFCMLTIYTTFTKMKTRVSLYYDGKEGNLFSISHYKSEYNRKELKRIMQLIPDTANLSALSPFAPHLSFRKNIYQYPDIHDAQYILIAKSETAFPVRGIELTRDIESLNKSPDWETIAASGDIYLFRRKN